MVNRFVLVVVIVPIAIVLIALAVANRGLVPFTLDPFNPGNPALTLTLPLFVFMFLTLAVGVLLGSMATWWKQGHYRKVARQKTQEAQSLRDQVIRQSRPDQIGTGAPALPKP